MKKIISCVLIVLSITIKTCDSKCLSAVPMDSGNSEISAERELYAKKIASYMDTTVDPCNDFNQYACGNYFKVNNDRKKFTASVISHVDEDMGQEIAMILSEELVNGTESSADYKARQIYQQCMAEDIFAYKPSEVYLKLIESVGGWPAINFGWDSDTFDWVEMISTMKNYYINTIIDDTVDLESNTECNIRISARALELYGNICDDVAEVKKTSFYKINEKLAMFLLNKYGVYGVKAENVFNDFISFVRTQCMYYYNIEEDTLEITVAEMNETILQYDWERYFQLTGIIPEDQNSTLSICLENPKYIEKITNFLNTNSTETKRQIANALALTFLFNLHEEFYFSKNKQEYCLQLLIENNLTPILSSLYIRSQYHRESSEDEVLIMASYVKSALKSIIKATKWLDKETKQNALKKLKYLHVNVDDADATLSVEKLDEDYSDLDVSSESFHENVLSLKKFKTNIDVDTYFKVEAHASYNRYYNTLSLPPGVVRKPFYYPQLPKSYNFGSMGGSLIGHEIGHAFDPKSINYDEKGDEFDWWTNETRQIYDEKAQCFVDQYNEYTIEGLGENIDGEKTLDDNVADHIGMNIGYYAYKKWLQINEPPIDVRYEVLPGLNLTNWQLYFVSLAQTRCDWHDSKGIQYVKDDDHTQTKWRNIGMIVNSNEFAKEFNCPTGSPMNPEQKCSIW